MRTKYSMIFIAFLLIASILLASASLSSENPMEEEQEFFFGIDVAYDDPADIKKLIDEVSPYTNFFLLGSTGISHNATKLTDLCQYLYDKNLYFIVYDEDPRSLSLLRDVEMEWGDKFLGLEYEDEIGGGQLDVWEYRPVNEATNHSDASDRFVRELNRYLRFPFPFRPIPSDFPLFTADYALYWFDYKAGYDTVLAEFGWNYSRQINVALCRGAATTQNKDWGVIITWTYDSPPYIESATELYDDLVLAYENGAKYVVVFDSNEDYTGGILKPDHLDVMEQFWKYTKEHPRKQAQNNDRVVYVLPKDFAYGFRGPDDKIWGLWEADAASFEISETVGSLLPEYGRKLDIIYDDGLKLDGTYNKYIFWNSSVIVP